MRAIVREKYGPPEVAAMTEVDRPTPGAGEVLVAVRASSVNTADLDFLTGSPPIARVALGVRRPRTTRMGCDIAGQVVALGTDVTEFAVGDEVWADLSGSGYSAFAEEVCVQEKLLARKPAALTFDEAGAVPHSAVLALQGLRAKGIVQPGQRVLINGAGGCVGPFAVQLAAYFGAEVTGVDHPAKLDFVTSAGADHTIDYTSQDVTANGQRYDLILDIAATRPVWKFRRLLAPRGRYVLIARDLAGFVQAFLVGGVISIAGSKRMGIFNWVPSRRSDLDFLSGLFDNGRFRPIIDSRYDLSRTPEALRKHADGRARGKIVIVP